MSRIISILITFLVTLLVDFFQPGGVTVRIDIPEQVVAGNEIEVFVTVNKGDLESFSRFQMDIPAGLIATPVVSANADFSFSEKKVRLVWLRLPSDNEMTFSYKIKVDERLKGTFSVNGQLSFILNNERQSVVTNSSSVIILPSPTVDPALIVDISEFEEKVNQFIPVATAGSENIACIRQVPALNESGSEFIVYLLVNKENKEKFAKIEETVPQNYTAVGLETKDAIFTFKNQVAKFLWMNLPSEPSFVVSYRLIPKNNGELIKPVLRGVFSYLVEEKTIIADILEANNDIRNLSQDQINTLIAELKVQPVKQPDEIVAVKAEDQNIIKDKETGRVTESKPDKVKKSEIKQQKTVRSNKNMAYLLEPESGIYYRVQVAAGHKTVNMKNYFKRYNLEMDVKKEDHDGWIKYSIGSFNIYKDARDYRVHIWNTTAIKDAFVSAYNSGNRITVQEALMIADQKWYK